MLTSLLLSVVITSVASSAPTHPYTPVPKERPAVGAFQVDMQVPSLKYCYDRCDDLAANKTTGPCAGFTLLNASGVYLCAYYHSGDGLGPPNPPDKDLIAYYKQGPAGPAPAPAPPLPPAPVPPPPVPPPPRAPDHFLCTLMTDVNGSSSIVLNISRASAPFGVDQFHELARIGFFNNSAFLRYSPGVLVQWGVSGNSTLDKQYGHKPIKNDPVVMSNTFGTVSFAQSGDAFKLRATEVFINLEDNTHLDSEGFAPFATVVGNGMDIAKAIHNPTPNSTRGVPAGAYAENGNTWIRKTYPGINFITGVTLSYGVQDVSRSDLFIL